MKKQNKKSKKIIWTLLLILCIGVLMGMVLGKYTITIDKEFGLIISPAEEVDYSQKRYFRSNELMPISEDASYTVNGTGGWFTVANALDSNTVSEDAIRYTLTWYVSEDGETWDEYKKETGTFVAEEYRVDKFTVEPVSMNGKVYNKIKVCGNTSSFLQEEIVASYTFIYSDYDVETTYADGVITVDVDTNDIAGEFEFSWVAGIAPDNSDPLGIFTSARAGKSDLETTLNSNTAYQFLFFVTDEALLQQLNADPNVGGLVTMIKK